MNLEIMDITSENEYKNVKSENPSLNNYLEREALAYIKNIYSKLLLKEHNQSLGSFLILGH